MAFTKITNTELNSRGATTLANQPAISPQALKEEFDAPAKEVVAPKFNNLIDELEASTAAASIGAVAPTGQTGNNVQAILDSIAAETASIETRIPEDSADITDAVNKRHTHDNKALLDSYNQTNDNIADAVTKKHSHSNKSLLDTYEQTEIDLADAVTKKHSHSNKSVLDKFSESAGGEPLYNGNPIGGGGGGGVSYSTTEQDTGLTWIDGSHIYKKTLVLPQTTYIYAGYEQLDDSVVKVISLEGYAEATRSDNNVRTQIPLGFFSTGTNTVYFTVTQAYKPTNKGVQLFWGFNFKEQAYDTDRCLYITVYYLKSN